VSQGSEPNVHPCLLSGRDDLPPPLISYGVCKKNIIATLHGLKDEFAKIEGGHGFCLSFLFDSVS
jgi:hypothetical protein